MSVKKLQPTTFVKGNSYLFVIAINAYKNSLAPLENCIKDAQELVALLHSEYQFEAQHTLVLENEKATRKTILTELKNYKDKLRPEDNLLLAFSGHGANIDGIGYWIPADAMGSDETTYISSDDIINRLNLIKCRHQLLIVDACFSGSIFRNTRSSPPERTLMDETRASRWGLSASHSREAAFDGESGDNSPFMKYLLMELKTRKQPTLVQDIAGSVMRQVQEETQDKQTPVFRPLDVKGDDLGQFVFHPKNAFYRFENVLGFLQAGKKEEALNELDNYCKLSERLPEGYEYDLALLFYKARHLDEFRNAGLFQEADYENYNNNFRFFQTEKLASLRYIRKREEVKYREVLNYIGLQKLNEALELVLSLSRENTFIFQEFVLMSARFKLLEKNFSRGIIDANEFFTRSEYYTEFFLTKLELAEEGWLEKFNKKEMIRELITEARDPEALLLAKDLFASRKPNSEEWSLMQMILQMSDNIRYKSVNNLIKNDDRDIYRSKIAYGLLHLVDKVDLGKPDFDRPPLDLWDNNEKSRGLILELIENGEFSDVLDMVQTFAPGNPFLLRLRSELISAKSITTTDPSYAEACQVQVAEKLLHFLNSIISTSQEKTLDITPQVGLEKNEKQKDLADYFDTLWSLVLKGEKWEVIVGLIRHFDLSEEQQWKLKLFEYQWDQNNEDKYLTDKPVDLIYLRTEKIYENLLQLIDELKPRKKTKVKKEGTVSDLKQQLKLFWDSWDYENAIETALQMDLPAGLIHELLLIQLGFQEVKFATILGVLKEDIRISIRSQLIDRLSNLMKHEKMPDLLVQSGNRRTKPDALDTTKVEKILWEQGLDEALQFVGTLHTSKEVAHEIKSIQMKCNEIKKNLDQYLISFDRFQLERGKLTHYFLELIKSV